MIDLQSGGEWLGIGGVELGLTVHWVRASVEPGVKASLARPLCSDTTPRLARDSGVAWARAAGGVRVYTLTDLTWRLVRSALVPDAC